jgi:hypothetical protein
MTAERIDIPPTTEAGMRLLSTITQSDDLRHAAREAYLALREIGCIAPAGESATGQQCYACRARERLYAALDGNVTR